MRVHGVGRSGCWPCWRAFLAAACLLGTTPVAAEVLLYRGDHVYVLPIQLSGEMLDRAGREQWRHFAGLARDIDADGDGVSEFHAIALGAVGGYGVQVRYRLHAGADAGSQRLGRWYWGVITGPDRSVLFETFNQ